MRPAECLIGLDLQGDWHVEAVLRKPPTSTGGKFSVGYLVKNRDGRKAYLKALDFSSAFNQPDPARALQAMTTAYNFERDLLAKCSGRRLKRVVTPLADGTVSVPGNFGPLSNVSYLIFELASGDIRKEVEAWNEFDLAWALRSLHESAVGIRQLHSIGIAHQDLKPSNVLVFPDFGSKIADLGRASYIHTTTRLDSFQIPGDVGYCPPEQWYGFKFSDFSHRYISDLYLLGSLIFFYFMRCSATQAIQYRISQKHKRNFSRTNFLQDLPYIQHALAETLSELHSSVEVVAGNLTDEIVMIARQLCEPDPRRRGDSRISQSLVPQHDLQPYISRFDRLARRAEYKLL